MGELKPGWERVKFGDVVRLNRETSKAPEEDGLDRYLGLEHLVPGDLRVRSWGNIADGTTFTNRFRPGQVLFGKRRAYQRKVAVADFEGVCSGDIYVLETKNHEALLPELLPFICQTDAFFEHAVGTSAGSLSPRTNWTSLAAYEFALPPLDEQRRLARILQAVDQVTAATYDALQDGMRTRLALMEGFLQHHSVSPRPLDDLLVSTSYGSSTRAASERGQHAIPILRIPNVLRGSIDLGDLKFVELTPKERVRYSVEEGDILLVRTNGNPDYVGRCVVAGVLPEPCVYASYLIRLRVNTTIAVPAYLAATMNSPSTRRALRGSVRSSAGNYNLNTQGIRRQRVPVPNISCQRKLVKQLDELGRVERALADRAREHARLKSRMLAEALA